MMDGTHYYYCLSARNEVVWEMDSAKMWVVIVDFKSDDAGLWSVWFSDLQTVLSYGTSEVHEEDWFRQVTQREETEWVSEWVSG